MVLNILIFLPDKGSHGYSQECIGMDSISQSVRDTRAQLFKINDIVS